MSEQQTNQATAEFEAVEAAAIEAPAVEAAAETAPDAIAPEEEAADTAPVAQTPAAPVAEAEEESTPEPVAEAEAEVAPEVAPEPVAEAEAEAAPEAAPEPVAEAAPADDGQPVVRMLSVGQEVKGIVKRITEFGAFVDIGVGRDGLVHISELSAKRVGKVSDVLQDGQEVQLWIKKLDRERNRISLTMIEPGKRTIRDLQKGEVVEGTVTRLLPYGAFIDIGIGRDALLHVREMAEGFVAKPEDVVKIGQTVEVRVIEIARRRSRVDLSMKGLHPEAEASAQPQTAQSESGEQGEQGESARPAQAERPARPARPDREQQFQQRYQQGRGEGRGEGRNDRRGDRRRQQEPEPEPIIEPDPNDEFADVEVLTPMQLAFKRAQERSGVVLPTGKGKGDRRQDTDKKRAQQEDIMARTLNTNTNRK